MDKIQRALIKLYTLLVADLTGLGMFLVGLWMWFASSERYPNQLQAGLIILGASLSITTIVLYHFHSKNSRVKH